MPTASETLATAAELLKQGQVQTAADFLATSVTDAKAAEALAAGVPLTPPPPREPDAILYSFMEAVSNHLGNPPSLLALIEEIYAALNPPAPAPAAAPAAPAATA